MDLGAHGWVALLTAASRGLGRARTAIMVDGARTADLL